MNRSSGTPAGQRSTRRAATAPGDRGPDPLTIALLGELARGRTTTEAAAACNVSRATAWRRLELLRAEWRVDRNIELIVQAVRRDLI